MSADCVCEIFEASSDLLSFLDEALPVIDGKLQLCLVVLMIDDRIAESFDLALADKHLPLQHDSIELHSGN